MQKNKKNNIINFFKKKSKIEMEIEAIIFSADEPLDLETIEGRLSSRVNVKDLENYKKNIHQEE